MAEASGERQYAAMRCLGQIIGQQLHIVSVAHRRGAQNNRVLYKAPFIGANFKFHFLLSCTFR